MNKRYFYIYFFLLLISLNVFSLRFEGKTFIISPELDLENIQKIFNLKETKYSSIEDRFDFLFYRISKDTQKVMPISFLSRLFDDSVFFPNRLDNINFPAILTNYLPKYSNKPSFEDYLYFDFKEKGGIFVLFITDSIERDTRFYYYEDPLSSLQKFYLQNKELINKNTPVLLFSDVSYQNFRKISEKADFIDYIINFQDFEDGNIYNKKIRNIRKNKDLVYQIDILFGIRGFLTFDFHSISLEKIDPSMFMKRIVETRRFENENR